MTDGEFEELFTRLGQQDEMARQVADLNVDRITFRGRREGKSTLHDAQLAMYRAGMMALDFSSIEARVLAMQPRPYQEAMLRQLEKPLRHVAAGRTVTERLRELITPAKEGQEKAPGKSGQQKGVDRFYAEQSNERRWFVVADAEGVHEAYKFDRGVRIYEATTVLTVDVDRADLDRLIAQTQCASVSMVELGTALHQFAEDHLTIRRDEHPKVKHRKGPTTGKFAKKRRWG